MNPRDYLENMLMNMGLGLNEGGTYYAGKNELFQKDTPQRVLLLHGIEVPLIHFHHNEETLKKKLEGAKETFLDSVSMDVTTSEFPMELYEKTERFCAETLKYYGKVLEPNAEALNLMEALVTRTLSSLHNSLSSQYQIYGANLNQISDDARRDMEDADRSTMARAMMNQSSSQSMPMKSHSKAYVSPFSGMVITDTTFTTESTSNNNSYIGTKNELERNRMNAYAKERSGMMEETERLGKTLGQMIPTTINDFVSKFKDIVIKKHSEYFSSNTKMETEEYWKKMLLECKKEDLTTLKEILRFYEIDFSNLLETTLVEHIKEHYTKYHTEYQGNDLDLYLAYHNLDHLDASQFSLLRKEFKKYYQNHPNKEEMKNCMYLTESDKESLQ